MSEERGGRLEPTPIGSGRERVFAFTCDRCGEERSGAEYFGDDGKLFATSGFYAVDGAPWRRFANEGERRVCTPCMQSDARYQAIYGVRR